MDFLQTLRAHAGGLIRLKGELFWYGGRGPDRSPGRVCLLLDASATGYTGPGLRIVNAADFGGVGAFAERLQARTAVAHGSAADDAVALLLIDGAPRWVWVERADVELIT